MRTPILYPRFRRLAIRFLAAPLLGGLPLVAQGQAPPVFERAQVIGAAPAGLGNSSVRALVLGAQGRQYVAGTFSGTVQFGPTTLTSAGGQDAYVGCLDANGTWLWAAPAGGAGEDGALSLQVDAAGHAYVGGWFRSAQLQLGPRTLNNSSNQPEAFVAKLDANGNWLWARRAGGTGGEYVTGLALVGTTLHAAGTFASVTADFGPATLTNYYTRSDFLTDIFLARIDASTGAWLDVMKAGGLGNDNVSDMTCDSQGALYLTGMYDGTSSAFGSLTLSAPGSMSKPFVAKLAPNRTWRWATAGDAGRNIRGGASGGAIVVDGQGRVTIAGTFVSPDLRFGAVASLGATGPADLDGYLPGDGFVAQLDSLGAWRWAHQSSGPGNDGAGALAVDGFGHVTAAVTFERTAAFGPTSLSSAGGRNTALVRFDTNGAWQWVLRAGGSANALLDDGAERLYLGGTFTEATADFGPFNLPGNPRASGSLAIGTGFLARLGPAALAAAGATRARAFAVFPNPARAYVDLSGLPPGSTVQVYDALGRAVAAGAAPAGGGVLRLALPATLPAGVYLVRAAGRTQRLLVE
ncbi:hypothetical protein GCM10027048_01320 [Hymenobacter coalescens]